MKLSVKEAKERAGRFCALRERSPNEVMEKLKSWGVPLFEANEITNQLIDLNYIDEQRFANAFCHDKFEFNSWGKQKIKANIHGHKISQEVVERALERIDHEKYLHRLRELARKKWEKHSSEETIKRKSKTVNYLASKGYEPNLIWNAISLLEKGH